MLSSEVKKRRKKDRDMIMLVSHVMQKRREMNVKLDKRLVGCEIVWCPYCYVKVEDGMFWWYCDAMHPEVLAWLDLAGLPGKENAEEAGEAGEE